MIPVFLYNSWKHQIAIGFLIFSRDIESDQESDQSYDKGTKHWNTAEEHIKQPLLGLLHTGFFWLIFMMAGDLKNFENS